MAQVNTYVLLFTDRFGCRVDMYPVTDAELTVKVTVHVLVGQYIPSRLPENAVVGQRTGYSSTRTSSRLFVASPESATLSRARTPPNGNGGTERVTIDQMPHTDVIERQDDWDMYLPRVEFD